MLRRIRLAQLMMDSACEQTGREIRIMEMCGSHTISLFRNAIHESVPRGLKILSGSGCSVCSASGGYLKLLEDVAGMDDCILAGRGDLIKNAKMQSKKEDVFSNAVVASSVLEALDIARIEQDKTVVYAGVGFETCIGGAAIAVKQATEERLENFCILSGYKKSVAGMKALYEKRGGDIDGFLYCGHMAAVMGTGELEPITKELGVPCVAGGFEPMQQIEGVAELCRQIKEGVCENCYDFSVSLSEDGNSAAKEIIGEYFEAVDGNWRGLGLVEKSCYGFRAEYEQFDAVRRLGLVEEKVERIDSRCRCDEVLAGLITPLECEYFGDRCNREDPMGPCMASSEGACFAWARYSRKARK
jgi:hydrogenase expression/formation protein HypD